MTSVKFLFGVILWITFLSAKRVVGPQIAAYLAYPFPEHWKPAPTWKVFLLSGSRASSTKCKHGCPAVHASLFPYSMYEQDKKLPLWETKTAP